MRAAALAPTRAPRLHLHHHVFEPQSLFIAGRRAHHQRHERVIAFVAIGARVIRRVRLARAPSFDSIPNRRHLEPKMASASELRAWVTALGSRRDSGFWTHKDPFKQTLIWKLLMGPLGDPHPASNCPTPVCFDFAICCELVAERRVMKHHFAHPELRVFFTICSSFIHSRTLHTGSPRINLATSSAVVILIVGQCTTAFSGD